MAKTLDPAESLATLKTFSKYIRPESQELFVTAEKSIVDRVNINWGPPNSTANLTVSVRTGNSGEISEGDLIAGPFVLPQEENFLNMVTPRVSTEEIPKGNWIALDFSEGCDFREGYIQVKYRQEVTI